MNFPTIYCLFNDLRNQFYGSLNNINIYSRWLQNAENLLTSFYRRFPDCSSQKAEFLLPKTPKNQIIFKSFPKFGKLGLLARTIRKPPVKVSKFSAFLEPVAINIDINILKLPSYKELR